jgi:YtcA-like protein
MNASILQRSLILLLAASLAGCARFHSPTIDVLGSYFPAWMVCMVCGLFLTLITRLFFVAARLRIYPAPFVYPCLIAAFTLAVWLIFFQN